MSVIMSDEDKDTSPDEGSDMVAAVKRRQAREAEWRRTGERPVWRNLSMIGAIGWLIVTPILLGILAGRWLDERFETGIFWSGALIMLGAAVGGYLAWQRIREE
jgi:ATP synthase protein I